MGKGLKPLFHHTQTTQTAAGKAISIKTELLKPDFLTASRTLQKKRDNTTSNPEAIITQTISLTELKQLHNLTLWRMHVEVISANRTSAVVFNRTDAYEMIIQSKDTRGQPCANE